MPRYFDEEDKNGVRITIDPKGIFRGHKKLKKLFSPSISVGKKAKLLIKFEKLKSFNEQNNMEFWHGKAILEKMPKGNLEYITSIVFLENEQIFVKKLESEFTSCEGDLEYKVGYEKRHRTNFIHKDNFPLYTANVRSTEWNKRDVMMVIFGGVMSFVITNYIFPLLGL